MGRRKGAMTRRLTWPIVFVCAAAASVIAAEQQQTVFSSRATGVRIDVVVLQGSRPVRGLTAADFEVRDNDALQSIDSVESNDAPINAVLALDTSGSTKGRRLADLVDAGRALIDGLKPQDRGALTTFNNAVIPRVPLTSDLAALRTALAGISAEGSTALMDGLYVALATTMDEPGRSLIVVCTDGQDTASWLQEDEVSEAAKRSNAVIYALTSADARRAPALKELTDLTGGHLIEVAGSGGYKAELGRVLSLFRSGYVLTFTPKDMSPGFHRLSVKVRRGGMTVKARRGYLSGGA
jgi:VWFA-related protein